MAHREAAELLVSILQRYHRAQLTRTEPSRKDAGPAQIVYTAINPPGERCEIYLHELEQAGWVTVKQVPADPADGAYIPDTDFPHGTATIVEPTREAYERLMPALEKAERRKQH